MPAKQPIQWAWIEEQYQYGKLSTRAIANAHKEQFGNSITETAIRKRASQYGWQRDLSEAIQRETRRRLAEGAVPEEVRASSQESSHFAVIEKEVATVEAAADEAVRITLKHRAKAEELHALTDLLTFNVAAMLRIREDGSPVHVYEPGELKDIAGIVSTVGTTRARAIDIERKAFSLDSPQETGGIRLTVAYEGHSSQTADPASGADRDSEDPGAF